MIASTDPPAPQEHSRREDDVLERIAAIVTRGNAPRGEVHLGDDCAVLSPFMGEALISTDVSVWGVHLDAELFPIEDLGFKAVAAAVSDIAAMGGRARACVVAVTSAPGTDLEALHRGIAEAASLIDCPVVGGDLARGLQTSVAVTVVGECPGRGAILRSGARVGDEILVTGPLGRSAAGLRRRRAGAPLSDELVMAHRRPWPRLGEGLAARGVRVHAMMDLSDGLGLDLHRLADASRVGFELDDVPVGEGASEQEALSGGEDYELLMTSEDPERLVRFFSERGLRAPISVGRIVADSSVRTLAGRPLAREGFQHDL